MSRHSRFLILVLLTAATSAYAVPPLPIPDDAELRKLGAELERLRGAAKSGDAIQDSPTGKAASTMGSVGSANQGVGDAINAAFTFRDLLQQAADASSLLDKAIDGTLEPDLDGYSRGHPDTPMSLCRGRTAGGAECEQCFAAAGETLTNARYNLEKLRVHALATKNYVSTKIAVGDGLSGITGIAALEWQKQRIGINKQFDKFKVTYDGKYEEMMKGLQTAMTRYDTCESQFGERDWYNRFGFLYTQFMADKYKRNF